MDKVDVMGGTGKNQSQAEQICLYTVFRKKTPTHIFFHISMRDV